MADPAASIAQRLLAYAKNNDRDYQAVLTQYGLERVLYRLSRSAYADQFLLKGALLFLLWHDLPDRPTRDIDLLGFGPSDVPSIERVFIELCAIEGHDGVIFDADSVKGEAIRNQAGYGGVRVTMIGRLKSSRLPVQVDIGFGDVVTPEANREEFPVILSDIPSPNLRVYPKYTVCAEKIHAINLLAMANTRLKDYYDAWLILDAGDLEAPLLGEAIAATFRRRGTLMPQGWPVGLTSEFSKDTRKQRQWNAFTTKNGLVAPSLGEVVDALCANLIVPMAHARDLEKIAP